MLELPLRIAVGLADGQVLVSTVDPVNPALDRFETAVSLSSPVTAIEWLSGASVLVAASDNGNIGVIPLPDIARGRLVNTGHQIDAPGIGVVGSDAFIGCAVHGGEQGLWGADGKLRATLRVTGERISAMGVDPATEWLAIGHVDGTFEVWERDLGDFERSAPRRITEHQVVGHGSAVTALLPIPAVGPDGRDLLLCGHASGLLALVDPMSGKELGGFGGHGRTINGLARLVDSRRVASWSVDGSLSVWDVDSQRAIGSVYSRGPFVGASMGSSGRIYAFDGLGQVWALEVRSAPRMSA
jgi:WD domain, G-beta repeat